MEAKNRCWWAGSDPLYIHYHDWEWGRPLHDDQKLFEMLILEGAQAGLSWLTILKRRKNYRRAFCGFDPLKVSRFSAQRKAKLMLDHGIIRNRLKIEAAVTNARAFLSVQREHGSFDRYIWSFVGGRPLKRHPKSNADVPANTSESYAMSRDLKKLGFKFVGSTICYAFMQACGLIDDHVATCYLAAKPASLNTARLNRKSSIMLE